MRFQPQSSLVASLVAPRAAPLLAALSSGLFWALLRGLACILFLALPGARPAAAELSLIGEVLERLEHDYVDAAALDPARLLDAALERASDAYPGVIALRTPPPGGRSGRAAGGAGEAGQAAGAPWRVAANGEALLIGPREAESWSALAGALGRVRAFLAGALAGAATAEELEIALIEGLLGAVDPHTEFFTPRAYREFLASASGNIGGIGLIVSQREGAIQVEEVLPGAPGERAGIRPGERIVEIGARFAEGMTIDEAVQLLRGEPGQPVELGLLGPGERVPRRLRIVRASIHFPSAEGGLLLDGEGAIGYARLRAFQPDSVAALRRLLEPWAAIDAAPLGLILDLRGNPGGGLNQAIDAADLFLSGGAIVTTTRPGRAGSVSRAHGDSGDIPLPLVVLIDERSASASEIVAAALKNNGRAALIGERSVGKATVQTVFFLSGGNALKLTIAQYLPPGDRSIQGVGVTPHVVLRPVRLAPGRFQLRPEAAERALRDGRRLAVPQGLEAEPPLAVLPFPEEPPAVPGGPVAGGAGAASARTDRALDLARRVLATHARGKAEAIVETLLRVHKEEALAAEVEIAARLRALGIDWRAAPPTAAGQPPALLLERAWAEVSADGRAWRPAAGGARPGERLRFALAVRNAEARPAARVLAVVRGASGEFEERELPLGWVEPGGRVESRAEWALPRSLVPPVEPLELILLAQGSREPLAREWIFLPIRAAAAPRYAATLTLREEGDGDGRWERGEALALRLRLANFGPAASTGGRLLVQWPEPRAAVLEDFPIDVPPIAPAGAWEAEARLRLEDDAEQGPWPVTLRARDLDEAAARLEARLALPAELPASALLFLPPAIELETPPPRAAGGSLNLDGRVRDDRSAQHLTIRVNGRKAFYRAAKAPAPEPVLAFQAELPLETGWNRILVEARDGDDLVTRRQFGVWRADEPGFPFGDAAR